MSRALVTDEDGTVIRSIEFDHRDRAKFVEWLTKAGHPETSLWNLSEGTLAMMVRDETESL